jgi:hypothetical protein
VVSGEDVATDPIKIQAIANRPTPSCLKELRNFLGLVGYYRKFIHHVGIICQPLNVLFKKGVIFKWTSDHYVAFQTLKKALMTAPVLSTPDFSTPFTIETNTNDIDIRAILMQHGHPEST